jgi:hypothetical protein
VIICTVVPEFKELFFVFTASFADGTSHSISAIKNLGLMDKCAANFGRFYSSGQMCCYKFLLLDFTKGN